MGDDADAASGHDRQARNATLDAAISSAANGMSFADLLLGRGQTIVVMEDDGRITWRRPHPPTAHS